MKSTIIAVVLVFGSMFIGCKNGYQWGRPSANWEALQKIKNNRTLPNGDVLEDGVEYKPIPIPTGGYCPKGRQWVGPFELKEKVYLKGKLIGMQNQPAYLCPGGAATVGVSVNLDGEIRFTESQ